MYGEIWPRVAGKTFKQISESGGFQSSQDFMEFAKKCCEAILRLWGVGLQHGDLTSHNVMWDGEKRAVTLIDYEDMDEVGPDEKNIDVNSCVCVILEFEVDLFKFVCVIRVYFVHLVSPISVCLPIKPTRVG